MSDYIPTELLAEILIRLPVQTLIRFTSVCKSWYSLITSPSFITKHLNHSTTTTNEILVLNAFNLDERKERYLLRRGGEIFGDEFSKLEYPLETPFVDKRILGSCNGLLCIVTGKDTLPPRIDLWNPSIKKSLTLPAPPLPRSDYDLWFVWGFGAHPKTHEYMVVFIVYEMSRGQPQMLPCKVQVYTQGTGSWRSVASTGHPHCAVAGDYFPAFVNGAVHSIALEVRGLDAGGPRSLIMLFNMGSQAFSVFIMPTALGSVNPFLLSIASYGESLAVLCQESSLEGPLEGPFSIWVMKEYGVAESWAKLYNITPPILLDQNHQIAFRKNGEVLLSTFDHQLLSYDRDTKTFVTIGYAGYLDFFVAHNFVDSLVLVLPGHGFF